MRFSVYVNVTFQKRKKYWQSREKVLTAFSCQDAALPAAQAAFTQEQMLFWPLCCVNPVWTRTLICSCLDRQEQIASAGGSRVRSAPVEHTVFVLCYCQGTRPFCVQSWRLHVWLVAQRGTADTEREPFSLQCSSFKRLKSLRRVSHERRTLYMQTMTHRLSLHGGLYF